MRPFTKVLFTVLALLLLALISYWISAGWEGGPAFATTFGGLGAVAGLLIAAFTLQRIKEAQDFSVIGTVHGALNKRLSYLCRRYLYLQFTYQLSLATKEALGTEYASDGIIHFKEISKNLTANEDDVPLIVEG